MTAMDPIKRKMIRRLIEDTGKEGAVSVYAFVRKAWSGWSVAFGTALMREKSS